MAAVKFLQVLALALLASFAAAQEFPFKNGPLDPTLHSNKIFFNITDVSAIQGVWKGITSIVVNNMARFWTGEISLEEMCSEAAKEGLLYSLRDEFPLTALVLPPKEEGQVANVIDMFIDYLEVDWHAIEYEDGVMRMNDDSCIIWKPYFDWEVGKTMFLRNRRVYVWFENGQIQVSDRQYCLKGDVDHPYCSRQSFLIDGQEKDGVILESIGVFECTAGPCLELPHTLPGFVKTQGWQPRD